MHGLGNDFVVLDGRNAGFDVLPYAQVIADRRFGVGCDQLIIAREPSVATPAYDARMEIVNADGSVVEMCGNGIRCFARWLYDHVGLHRETYQIETLAGRIRPTLLAAGQLRVAMGPATTVAGQLPANPAYFAADSDLTRATLEVDGHSWQFCGVQVGNPHFITLVDDVEAVDLARIGPQIERHPAFPKRINVEFVQRTSQGARVRVWERGSGITMACGTGATAVGAALFRLGLHSGPARIDLPGGSLLIEEISGEMYMTGPDTEVFSGTLVEAELKIALAALRASQTIPQAQD